MKLFHIKMLKIEEENNRLKKMPILGVDLGPLVSYVDTLNTRPQDQAVCGSK